MSLFIAFFSLLAAALLADRGRCWLRRRGRPVWLGYLAVGAVAALGVADETTNYFLPLPGFARREWRSDAAFTTEIERRLPRGAAIFQLPQVPFPEGYNEPAYTSTGAGGAAFGNEYELMRGYLHSSTLRWSYGAMKGRPADWASALTTKPLGYALDAAAVDGFDGLWVDLAGYAYADRPLVESQLRRITGSAALSSPLGDLRFYDLRPLRGRLGAERSAAWVRALRSDSLHPLTTTCTPTGLELTNPSPHRRAARLSFTLSRGISGPTPVLMHLPGRPVEVLRSTLPNAYLVRRLTLAHGTERVSFSYEGHPLVPHQLEGGPALINPDLVDARHERLDGTGYIAGLAPPACVQTVLALKSTNPLAQ